MTLLNTKSTVPFKANFHDGDAKHFLMWGPTGRGMSALSESGACRAAYVGANIVLISAEALDSNEMPPGFDRFLTPEECKAEGVPDQSA